MRRSGGCNTNTSRGSIAATVPAGPATNPHGMYAPMRWLPPSPNQLGFFKSPKLDFPSFDGEMRGTGFKRPIVTSFSIRLRKVKNPLRFFAFAWPCRGLVSNPFKGLYSVYLGGIY